MPLTRESPFIRRLFAYLAERFPLLGHGVLIAAYYSSNQFLARTLTRPGEPMHYDVSTVLGMLTLFCFFFHLRVFDEHKDYAEDCIHYPQRVLQSGVITLRDLKVLGGFAIAAEIVLCALRGPAVFAAWSAAFLFSLLMLREFFVREWLKRHFLVYAVTHLLVMPFSRSWCSASPPGVALGGAAVVRGLRLGGLLRHFQLGGLAEDPCPGG